MNEPHIELHQHRVCHQRNVPELGLNHHRHQHHLKTPTASKQPARACATKNNKTSMAKFEHAAQ